MSDNTRETTRPTGPRKIDVPENALQIMFTGSRTIKDHYLIREMIRGAIYDIVGLFQITNQKFNHYTRPIVVAEGGAAGLDTIVAHMATQDEAWHDPQLDRETTILRTYPADWDKYGRSAGMRRNQEMVLDSDACIAIWDGKSKGTMHAFKTAREVGLRTMMIVPDLRFVSQIQ